MKIRGTKSTIASMALGLGIVSIAACDSQVAVDGESGRTVDRKLAAKPHECRDKHCEGDVPPTFDPATEVVLKIDGKWYIGPRELFVSGNRAVFYWPSRTPHTGPRDGSAFPEWGRPFDTVAIEVFLGSPKISAPKSMYQVFEEVKRTGTVLGHEHPRPGLEIWRVKDVGRAHEEVWVLATSAKSPDGDFPTVSCRNVGTPHARCAMGFLWMGSVSVDIRFHGNHAGDWPEIYSEATRILTLLRRT